MELAQSKGKYVALGHGCSMQESIADPLIAKIRDRHEHFCGLDRLSIKPSTLEQLWLASSLIAYSGW